MKQKMTLEETIHALNMTMPAQTGESAGGTLALCWCVMSE